LVLYLQPDEGVHWRFEAKVPIPSRKLRSVDMEFHYADSFGKTAIPEAYERLLLDTLTGDASLFTRADEVETAWNLIDPSSKHGRLRAKVSRWQFTNLPRGVQQKLMSY